MPDRVRRYLISRKNLAGMAGGLAGASLAFADIGYWPAVAVGLYGVGALIGPSDPRARDERLTDALRADAAGLLARLKVRAGELPHGSLPAIDRILDVLRLVLDRLDQVADEPADRAAQPADLADELTDRADRTGQLADRAAAPGRLAAAAAIIRLDLPVCLDTYLSRDPSGSAPGAAAELVARLDVIAGAADGLARSVPGVRVRPAEELTRELLRRHGEPPVPP